MANINKQWRRVVAVGCSHGHLAHPGIREQVLAFKDRYRPQVRFDLGDIVDTAAFRAGAGNGTGADASEPVEPDFSQAEKWLRDYAPTHITWGNHDWRLMEWAHSPNAIVAHAAGALWGRLQNEAGRVKAKTCDYDYERNWFSLGGHYWGHGFWFNESAVRDHAEYLGGPVVMAHLHTPQIVQGRTRLFSPSYCVGTLADINRMGYARRRRATSRWGHGVVWGEVSNTSAKLWLSQCELGGTLPFPL